MFEILKRLEYLKSGEKFPTDVFEFFENKFIAGYKNDF